MRKSGAFYSAKSFPFGPHPQDYDYWDSLANDTAILPMSFDNGQVWLAVTLDGDDCSPYLGSTVSLSLSGNLQKDLQAARDTTTNMLYASIGQAPQSPKTYADEMDYLIRYGSVPVECFSPR